MNLKRTLLLIACGLPLAAQSANPLVDAVNSRYQGMKRNLIETADVMPEESYTYKLSPAQRAFGEWIEHTAMGNYGFCSTIKGEAPPKVDHPQMNKAALKAALQQSFEYCDQAMSGLTDAKALAAGTMNGKPSYPVNGMVGLVASLNEHYGNLVGYMRTKGITPPSSARGMKK